MLRQSNRKGVERGGGDRKVGGDMPLLQGRASTSYKRS